MYRPVVAGLLGLALAGCGSERSLVQRSRPKLPPVGLTPPMPSIHQEINRENPSFDAVALQEEHSGITPDAPAAPATTASEGRLGPIARRVWAAARPRPAATPAPAHAAAGAMASEKMTEPTAGAAPTVEPAARQETVAAPTDPAAAPNDRLVVPDQEIVASTPMDGSGAESATRLPVPAPADEQPAPISRDPLLGSDPDIMPRMDVVPPVRRPGRNARIQTEAAPSPPIETTEPGIERAVGATDDGPPMEGETAFSAARPRVLDPLLGPDPDIMPTFTLPPPRVRPEASPPPTAEGELPEVVEFTPPPEAVLPPTTAPARDPLLGPDPDVMPKIELPATAEPKPENPAPHPSVPPSADPVSEPIELPPLSEPERPKTTPSASTSSSRSGGRMIRRVSYQEPSGAKAEPESIRSQIPKGTVFEAGRAAARVGDEVITIHEVKVAFRARKKQIALDRKLTDEERLMIARGLLNELIDRSLVNQQARREIKNQKQFKMFLDMADKIWLEEELPPLLRQTSSANIHELKNKMAERDESLDDVREQFRQEFLFRGFMEQKLGPKMKVELPEMREYYNEHLKEFELPAQVTWREVLIEVEKHPSRAEARKKADDALARLRRGEDFAVVAKELTDGPNKSEGGLWKTAPGSYAVPAVNAALESLPAGQISTVLEGPTSYHVVRVEARRAEGPATFAEVQDRIRQELRHQKVTRESNAYLEKLRKQTVITTMFDDQGVVRASAEVPDPTPKAVSR